MPELERILAVVKDVVLQVDVRRRYDVYFSDKRVGIVCMGKAEREWETQETLSYMPSAFGVPAPIPPQTEKAQNQPSIDDEVKGMSLDDLLRLSKRSCFYTLEEIEKVELIWGSKPKLIILSKDCESKFSPDDEQFAELLDIIPSVEGLKDKLWVAGKYDVLFQETAIATPVCKSCGSLNSPDADYCQSCGNKLEEQPAVLPTSELTCSQCGTKNRAGTSFCKRCGSPLVRILS